MGYIIGSFNLCNFNMTATEDFHKNLDRIAEIIRNQRFDVVALQEIVGSETYLKSLTRRIGLTWKSHVCYSEGHSHDHAESYAYIWNDSRLRLIDEPGIFEDKGMKGKLVRPPMVARFSPCDLIGGLFFELRLINTHIAFGAPLKNSDLSDVEYRRKEFGILMEEVYPAVADKRFGLFMPAYTILMGDYNLCIVGDNKIKAYSKDRDKYDYTLVEDGRKSRVITTVQNSPSSLKTNKQFDYSGIRKTDNEAEIVNAEISEGAEDLYSQDYDHFSYDKYRFSGVGLSEPERVDALKNQYNNDLSLYRKEVSDHVPIKIVLDFNSPYINVEEVGLDD